MRWKLAVLGLATVLTTGALTGCAFLSAESAARADRITADLAALKGDYDALSEKLKGIVSKARSGELPAAEAVALLQEIEGRQGEIRARAERLQGEYEAVRSEGGASFWGLIASIGLNLLSGGAFVKTKGTLGTALKAFGAVSRALDTVTKGEAGDHVRTEIANSPGLTSEALKGLHALARDREI